MAVVRLILRLSSSESLLRLVVVPCLNAHKRHVRDPLYFYNGLHGLLLRENFGSRRSSVVRHLLSKLPKPTL